MQNGLNGAQTRALAKLKSASSQEYQKVTTHGKGSSSSVIGPGITGTIFHQFGMACKTRENPNGPDYFDPPFKANIVTHISLPHEANSPTISPQKSGILSHHELIR